MNRLLMTVTAVVMAALATSAAAQDSDPFAQRDTRVPAAVASLQAKGVKLTFLGDEGGLRAYLGESASGKMQTFYLSPNGSHFVAGIMFTPDGTNITGIQIGEMRARFDAAARSLGGKEAIDGDGLAGEPPANDVEEVLPSRAPGIPVDGGASADPLAVPDAATDEAAESEATGSAAPLLLPPADGPAIGAAGNPSELWISKIDREAFLEAASGTPYFQVGSKSAPVTLWMVADPKCPYCHAAWNHIRPAIADRKINVHVVMLAALEGSREIAMDMLSRSTPGHAFIRSNGGQRALEDAGQIAPDPEAGRWLDMNMEFAQKFGIDRTPFLGYTAENGQFYSALGLPSDLQSFFHAAGL